jgi:PAS domain S-box-containing protein
MNNRPKTVSEILAIINQPVVAIDHEGRFTDVNKAFTQAYGWTTEDLMGEAVTRIMPPDMRPAHQRGIDRFIATEEVRVAGKPIALPTLHKDGSVDDAEHYILGEKVDGVWRFAATIIPPAGPSIRHADIV